MKKTNSQIGAVGLSFPKRLLVIILRFFLRLLYHQFAWAYDGVASIVSLGAWHEWVQSVVPMIDGSSVLEIGFGPGHLLAALHHKKIAIYGLDESSQMVEVARKRLQRQGYRPNLIRGDAQTLPFANESFQQVVMTFPAEYFVKSSSIQEIKRILITRGMVLILPLAWITGQAPWERLVAWINHITGEAPDWDPSLLDSLKGVGFDVSWEMKSFRSSKIILIRLIKV